MASRDLRGTAFSSHLEPSTFSLGSYQGLSERERTEADIRGQKGTEGDRSGQSGHKRADIRGQKRSRVGPRSWHKATPQVA